MRRPKTWVSGPSSRSPGFDVLNHLYVDSQWSYADIAREYGVSAVSVMRWLRAAGIPARSISEATSIAQKGKPLSEKGRAATAESLKKANAAKTAETFAKQGETMRAKYQAETHWAKGTTWSDGTREQHAYRQTDEYREKQAEVRRGEKHHNWRGGTAAPHNLSLSTWQWRKRRTECYERDNWTCQDCRCKCLPASRSKGEPKRKIQAHHIIARIDGGTDDLDNLITLCMSCHHKREHKSRRES